MKTLIDLSGDRYGHLTVLSEAERSNHNIRRWLCRCDCGAATVVAHSNLRGGHTISCGCQKTVGLTKSRVIHGLSKTPEYPIWLGMRTRCSNPNTKLWKYYGGKGIKVCERWQKFENFYADMGPRPTPEHSIDRIDPDKDYCPKNCRWATDLEQSNNRPHVKKVEFRGQSKTLTQWSKELGLELGTLHTRIYKLHWTAEEALTKPRARKRQ